MHLGRCARLAGDFGHGRVRLANGLAVGLGGGLGNSPDPRTPHAMGLLGRDGKQKFEGTLFTPSELEEILAPRSRSTSACRPSGAHQHGR